ncbi:hypothetical protein [Pacificoceanicola onchidii]|uniref:hypothetical protein n=1 Tax=Pacificoceanicola onchidii TaxID=2562685 RepID=UPI0010A400D9|nr:hypothetical protein [Pacificoceanicola onchidii]
MSDTRMTIRNIDRTLYRRARVMAVENGMPMGELINHSLEFFMNEAEFVEEVAVDKDQLMTA